MPPHNEPNELPGPCASAAERWGHARCMRRRLAAPAAGSHAGHAQGCGEQAQRECSRRTGRLPAAQEGAWGSGLSAGVRAGPCAQERCAEAAGREYHGGRGGRICGVRHVRRRAGAGRRQCHPHHRAGAGPHGCGMRSTPPVAPMRALCIAAAATGVCCHLGSPPAM